MGWLSRIGSACGLDGVVSSSTVLAAAAASSVLVPLGVLYGRHAWRRFAAVDQTETAEASQLIQFIDANSSLQLVRGKRLRVVHIPHENKDVPVLFMLHGAGGQAEQWMEQIAFFNGRCSIVAWDNVGHGKSEKPHRYDLYARESIVQDSIELFHRYRGRRNVLLAHSYGTSVTTALYPHIQQHVSAIVMLGCIVQTPTTSAPHASRAWLLDLPDIVLDVLRSLDRRGGPDSVSVARMLHRSASVALKRRQLRWNANTPSHVVKALSKQAIRPTPDDFKKITAPVLLISGADDHLTVPANAHAVHEILGAQLSVKPQILPETGHQAMVEKRELVNALINRFLIDQAKFHDLEHPHHVQRGNSVEFKWSLKNFDKWRATPAFGLFIPVTAPPPPRHAWQHQRLSSPGHSPTSSPAAAHSASLARLTSSRLPSDTNLPPLGDSLVSSSSSSSSTSGNPQPLTQAPMSYAAIVSAGLTGARGERKPGHGHFVPMRVPRQDDDDHSPDHVASSLPSVGLVLDLGSDAPPYMPESFGQIEYLKLPSTSKIVPSRSEVDAFISAAARFWATHPDRDIGVHCHYGYNRTGFMICSYLIEVEGMDVASAIERFALSRAPGIRHQHFKDELAARYAQ
ncbi:hypothetical protein CAOG_03377 [Capsaspora owczarzaki ATCC 30864]|uniref:Tyrosine specific protein phosphatases domain-containing protein n=1 Tax=Capsaspora owczarzaki (strain ATCC 30864) TaxID=595528 RepID=A0A0D2X2E1_CAPO3|nr:hypothetical protein CAOG_03377 [Capsaspora owczarzaki ATCC 30864]KJE92399.1 hypothetical protein CAOG_003377 [Capsaspora owczarzaki ATCC 30864]|eukprot:XP_004364216.2 hypothetical protein CAOG_03377 [Capsaspora owczarzaki ATCC 30864]